MKRESFFNTLTEDDKLKVSLQPVVSLRRKKIIGFEAKFTCYLWGSEFSLEDMKKLAKKESSLLNFDRYARRRAFEQFTIFTKHNIEFAQTVLFLAVESSILKDGVVGSGNIVGLANEFKINLNRIAIEISDSVDLDLNYVKTFVQNHKDLGFIIVFDKVGSGCTNLERLTVVEPDIIKLDISIFDHIQKEYYRKGILQVLSGLAKTMGSLVCCTGIHKINEALISLDTGADLLQGELFYNEKVDGKLTKGLLEQKIEVMSTNFKAHLENKFNNSARLLSGFNFIAGKMAYELTLAENNQFEKKLRKILKFNDSVECLYILNMDGIKITESIFAKGKRSKSRKAIFKPAHIGTDHSSKEYYYNTIRSANGISISEPYISGASGNLCVTVSTIFMDEFANKFILCIDFDSDKTDAITFHT